MGDLVWSDKGIVDGMPVTISGGYVCPEQPLTHEAFLQRYVLATAGGAFRLFSDVPEAEAAWQGIRAIIKAETEVAK